MSNLNEHVYFGLARLTAVDLAATLAAVHEGGGDRLDTCAFANGDQLLSEFQTPWAMVTTKLPVNVGLNARRAVTQAVANRSVVRVLVHWPTPLLKFTWTELLRSVDRGVVHEVGVCNLSPRLFASVVNIGRPVVHQFESSPLGVNQRMVDLALEHSVRPQAWSPFGGPGAPVLRNEVVVNLAREYECSPAQVVVAWNLQRGVDVVVQATSVEHVRSVLTPVTLAEVDVAKLSAEDRGWTSDPMTVDYYNL